MDDKWQPWEWQTVYALSKVLLRNSLISVCTVCSDLPVPIHVGATVAHWGKRWPTDLAVSSLSPTQGVGWLAFETVFQSISGGLLLLSSAHPLDVTEILLKRM